MPNSVHIICGIMHYLRAEGQSDIDFFKDITFSRFRDVLDSEMKKSQREGVASKHRQAEPLTQTEEEQLLWKKGVLGGHTGCSLVDTMYPVIPAVLHKLAIVPANVECPMGTAENQQLLVGIFSGCK